MYFAVSHIVLKIPTVSITVYGSGKWEPDWLILEKITKVLRVVANNLNICTHQLWSGLTGLYPEALLTKQPVFPFENSDCKGCGYQGSNTGLTRPSTCRSIPGRFSESHQGNLHLPSPFYSWFLCLWRFHNKRKMSACWPVSFRSPIYLTGTLSELTVVVNVTMGHRFESWIVPQHQSLSFDTRQSSY